MTDAGVAFEPTGHVSLPGMSATGCVIPPHFRPLCTLHVCSINALGTSGDAKFDAEYFSLREEIEDVQSKEYEKTTDADF